MPFFSLPSGGSPVLAGEGAPTGALGNVGDLYLDTSSKLLYGPKAIGGWGAGLDLSQGPSGSVGATGPTGPQSMITGPTGGFTTLSIGTVTTGVTADVNVTGTTSSRTLNFVIPSVTGPTGAAATGPTGSTGSAGGIEYYATGPAPSSAGDGAVWLDTDTGRQFVRYSSTWIEVGVQGEAGSTGPTGASVNLSIGSVTTGPEASANITGTAPALTLDLVLPAITGPSGSVGPTGPSGGPTGESGSTGPTGAAGGFGDAQTINSQTSNYTLALSDAGKLITVNAATGVISVTLPPASSVAFPTGTHVDVARLGDAGVTVTGATGVTVHATPGQKLRAKYSSGTCILYAADTWLVAGDLAQ